MDVTPSARSISFAYEPDSVKGISKGLLFQPLLAKELKVKLISSTLVICIYTCVYTRLQCIDVNTRIARISNTLALHLSMLASGHLCHM